MLRCGPAECPSGNLRVNEQGQLGLNGGEGKFAQFVLMPNLDLTSGRPVFSEPVSLANFAHVAKGWCLGSDSGDLSGTLPASDPRSKFVFEPIQPGTPWEGAQLSSWPDFDESVTLSAEHIAGFVSEGYLHYPGAVDPPLVRAAVALINKTLCSPGGVVADDDGTKFCPSITGQPEILNLLYKSKVWTIAQRLIGRGRVQRARGAQIALRGPTPQLAARREKTGTEPGHLPSRQWHIDGMGKGKHSPFSLLVGVSLSPQTDLDCGNFCVFPGSHKTLLPLLKEQVEAGSPLFSAEANLSEDKPEFTNGIQVRANSGDAVFAHQKVAHRGGPNTSPNIRYQVRA